MEIGDLLLPIRGRVQIELGGEIVREMDNLFVNVGYQRVATFLTGQPTLAPGFISVGNGDGSSLGAAVVPAPGDTRMGFELLRRPVISQGLVGSATARFYAQFASTDAPQALTEVALWDSAGLTAQATAATATTLTDSTQNWTVNQWANWWLYIVNGTGVGQAPVQILSNTATVLTVGASLSPLPDATSTYTIGGSGSTNYLYAHAPITPTLTKTQQPMNVIWQLAAPQN